MRQFLYDSKLVVLGPALLVHKRAQLTGTDSIILRHVTSGPTFSLMMSRYSQMERGRGVLVVKILGVKSSWLACGEFKPSAAEDLPYGDRFNNCQVIYSQFGLAIHQNDHQARRRFVEWAQNEIAVVPDFHKRILFSDEAHFWLNGYVNKQNCRIWSEANPQVYVETPLHPEKLTVWCALWAGGILQKR
ncbi:hypothetical protein TNCV_570851 [Trichonephila clavipes]|nr:hypothetical protein TNCV_570851 [Trichonephila clavipes]